MQKVTLEQWRMLIAVVDCGGFNQAAATIHKSTSSIHHAVNKLEDSLGLKLVVADGRKTLLTDAGRVMYRRAKSLLEEVNRIEAVADSLSQGVETELRLAVDGAFPQQTILAVLEKVSALYPHIKIDILDTVLSGSNELIANGKADIGLSPIMMENGLNEELCSIEFVAVAHPDHPLHQLDRVLTKDDLKPYRQIIVRDSGTENTISAGWLGADQRWTVSSVRASIELVKQNFGFAWLPLPELHPLLQSYDITLLNLSEDRHRTVSFYLNYLDRDRIGPVAREFMGEIRLQMMQSTTIDDVELN